MKTTYKLREHKVSFYRNSFFYSALLISLWIFTPISHLIGTCFTTAIFREDLRNGLSILPLAFLITVGLALAYQLQSRIRSAAFHLPLNYCLLLLTVGAIYWYSRCFGNYIFFPISEEVTWLELRLLDIPYLIYSYLVIILLFHSLFQRDNPETYEKIILADRPLDSLEQDEYERKALYESFIDTIKRNAPNGKKSLSIGVVNRWGEGKTSFLKFINESLKDDTNTVVVQFNPWYSTDSNSLTFDFFQSLDREISKYAYTGTLIRKYAKNLTNINSVYNPFKYLPEKWVGDKPNQQYFEDINKLIKKINKRIVIIIDDLDRLDHKEVFSVLQVVRNSGAFSNTMFIIPFDKDYVIKSLIENKIPFPEEYIKKMFDVEVTLAAISKYHLINVFRGHLESSLKKLVNLKAEDEKKLIDQIQRILSDSGLILYSISKYSVINKFFFDHLKNKRELIRFTNSLVLSLRNSHQIIYLPDLLLLELIKYLNLDVYRKLFENTHYIQRKVEAGGVTRKNVLFSSENATAPGDGLQDGLNATLNDFDIRVKNGARVDVADLLEELFKEPPKQDFRGEYSIYYAQNYSNYHRLVQEGITQEEIRGLFDDDGQK